MTRDWATGIGQTLMDESFTPAGKRRNVPPCRRTRLAGKVQGMHCVAADPDSWVGFAVSFGSG